MPIAYSDREKPYALFRKGKQEGAWDPDSFDLTADVRDWAAFTDAEQRRFLRTASGFYDGEEDVTRTLAPYLLAVEALDNDAMPFDTVQQELYLAQQLYEEAKHTDFFSRYYERVFDTQDTSAYRDSGYRDQGYSTDDLYATAADLLAVLDSDDQRRLVHTLGEAYLNYMGIVEGQLARFGYMEFDQMVAIKRDELGRDVLPGFQAGVGKIRQDEARHIENGRWVLKQLAEYDPAIVTEVYEPRFEAYVENRVLGGRPAGEEPFEGFDWRRIGKQSKQHFQDTVDSIGAEKFDRFGDVGAAISAMRADAAADD